MAQSNRPRALRGLPSRPLRPAEVEAIDATSDRIDVGPGSILLGDVNEGDWVTVLIMDDHGNDRVHVVGFDPAHDRWTSLKTWDTPDVSEEQLDEVILPWDEHVTESFTGNR